MYWRAIANEKWWNLGKLVELGTNSCCWNIGKDKLLQGYLVNWRAPRHYSKVARHSVAFGMCQTAICRYLYQYICRDVLTYIVVYQSMHACPPTKYYLFGLSNATRLQVQKKNVSCLVDICIKSIMLQVEIYAYVCMYVSNWIVKYFKVGLLLPSWDGYPTGQ